MRARVGVAVSASQEPRELSCARELAIGVDLAWRVGDAPSDVDAVAFEERAVDGDLSCVSAHDAREAAQEGALA